METAPCPLAGQGSDGLEPATVSTAAVPARTEGRARGWLMRCAPAQPAAASRSASTTTMANTNRRLVRFR